MLQSRCTRSVRSVASILWSFRTSSTAPLAPWWITWQGNETQPQARANYFLAGSRTYFTNFFFLGGGGGRERVGAKETKTLLETVLVKVGQAFVFIRSTLPRGGVHLASRQASAATRGSRRPTRHKARPSSRSGRTVPSLSEGRCRNRSKPLTRHLLRKGFPLFVTLVTSITQIFSPSIG